MNSYKRSLYSGIVRIMANLLTLAAVFLAMYMVAFSTSAMTTFCLWFFGCIIPIWMVTIKLLRYIKLRFPAEDQSLIELPGCKPCLVTWRVLESDSRLNLSR